MDEVKKNLQTKVDEFDLIEREFHKMQEKHRDVLNSEYNLQTAKEHMEASLRIAQEEVKKLNQQYEDDIGGWKKERSDLVKRIHELMAQTDKVKDDGGKYTKLKSKYLDYKEKVRKANANIQVLMAKVAKYELERQAERENDGGRVKNVGGRESYASGKGSEYEIGEAIQKLASDQKM